MPIVYRIIVLCSILLINNFQLIAQNCDPWTPNFSIDFTTNPDSLWQSASVSRAGTCCTATNPDRCINFSVEVSSQTQSIAFFICGGNQPTGSLFYQVDCGTPIPIGEAYCVAQAGVYEFTFCQPGSSQSQYCLRANSLPSTSNDFSIAYQCVDTMQAFGTAENLRTVMKQLQATQDVDRVTFVAAPLRDHGCC